MTITTLRRVPMIARMIAPTIVVGTLALVLAACSTGPTNAPKPGGPAPGTVFHFERTTAGGGESDREVFRHRIVGRSGHDLLYHVEAETERATEDEVRLYRGLFSHAYWRPGEGWAEYSFDRQTAAGLWPLAAGNQVTMPVTFGYGRAETEAEARRRWRPSERGTVEWRVEGEERVRVGAGTYDTVVVVRRHDFTTLEAPRRRTVVDYRTWYAPRPGYIVRQTVRARTIEEPGGREVAGPETMLELIRIVPSER